MRKSLTFFGKLSRRRDPKANKESDKSSLLAPELLRDDDAADMVTNSGSAPKTKENASVGSKGGIYAPTSRFHNKPGTRVKSADEILDSQSEAATAKFNPPDRTDNAESANAKEMVGEKPSNDAPADEAEEDSDGAVSQSSSGNGDDDEDECSLDSDHPDDDEMLFEGCLDETPPVGTLVKVLYTDLAWHIGEVVAVQSTVEATIRYADSQEDRVDILIDAVRMADYVGKDAYDVKKAFSGYCPAWHVLVPFTTTTASVVCNKCEKTLEEDVLLHGCRKCDYCECESCCPKELFSEEWDDELQLAGTLLESPPVGTKVKILCEDNRWYVTKVTSIMKGRKAHSIYEFDDFEELLEFDVHYIRSMDYVGQDESGPPVGHPDEGEHTFGAGALANPIFTPRQVASSNFSRLRGIADSGEMCPSDPALNLPATVDEE